MFPTYPYSARAAGLAGCQQGQQQRKEQGRQLFNNKGNNRRDKIYSAKIMQQGGYRVGAITKTIWDQQKRQQKVATRRQLEVEILVKFFIQGDSE